MSTAPNSQHLMACGKLRVALERIATDETLSAVSRALLRSMLALLARLVAELKRKEGTL